MNIDPAQHISPGKNFPRVNRMIKKSADLLLEKSGLHHGQARLLMILSHSDGMSHSQIAKELHISPAAATKVIKRMEQEGYVQRRSDDSDERVSRVYLQEAGFTLMKKIQATFAELETLMFIGFTEDEMAALEDFLNRINQNLQEHVLHDPN
jgi:DNA-binding MarR family transcriptional regulator